MLNQVVIVGRLVEKPIVEYNQNERRVSVITLAVPRSYRNDEGSYDTDFIKCILWCVVAETTAKHCEKGDLIGIKGKLQCLNGEPLQVVAEKVTFLSNREAESEENYDK